MKLILTYHTSPDVFVVQALDGQGQQLSAMETSDLALTLKEVHQQLLRMRHLAKGKVFETKQPRSCA